MGSNALHATLPNKHNAALSTKPKDQDRRRRSIHDPNRTTHATRHQTTHTRAIRQRFHPHTHSRQPRLFQKTKTTTNLSDHDHTSHWRALCYARTLLSRSRDARAPTPNNSTVPDDNAKPSNPNPFFNRKHTARALL